MVGSIQSVLSRRDSRSSGGGWARRDVDDVIDAQSLEVECRKELAVKSKEGKFQ